MHLMALPDLSVVLYCATCKDRVKKFETIAPTLNSVNHASKNHKRKHRNDVPLEFDDKVIGTAVFDSENGIVSGHITDGAFAELLKEQTRGLSIEDFPTKGDKK
jgi:hypothetical protein